VIRLWEKNIFFWFKKEYFSTCQILRTEDLESRKILRFHFLVEVREQRKKKEKVGQRE